MALESTIKHLLSCRRGAHVLVVCILLAAAIVYYYNIRLSTENKVIFKKLAKSNIEGFPVINGKSAFAINAKTTASLLKAKHASITTEKVNSHLNVYDLKTNISDNLRRATLKTNRGNTPIFVYQGAKDRWVSEAIVQKGAWEGSLIDIWQQYLLNDPQSCGFDIGANLGQYGLAAIVMNRSVVFADPIEGNIRRITKSLQVGKYTSRATVLLNAISDKSMKVYFRTFPGNVGGTQILAEKDKRIADQSLGFGYTVTLDDLIHLCKDQTVVMKVDVECHEKSALGRGEQFLTKRKVIAIIMEWHDCTADADSTPKFIETMGKYGFTAYQPAYPPVTVLDVNKARKKWPGDVLWIHERFFRKYV